MSTYLGFGDDIAAFKAGKPAVCRKYFGPAHSARVRITQLSANALLQEDYDYAAGDWGEKHLWHVVGVQWRDDDLHVEISPDNLYLDAQGRWSQFERSPGHYKPNYSNVKEVM